MLGGSFWVSFVRNGLGSGLMMAVFMLLEHPRASLKKTVRNGILFWIFATSSFSIWYMLDSVSFVRFAGMLSIPMVGIFCLCTGRESLYLSLYKLTLGFYLLSVTVFCGVDLSRLWFGGSIWADIIVRIVLVSVILFVLVAKIRKSFLAGVDYLREELDLFSAVTLLVSILVAALMAFWPDSHELSYLHIGRTAILLFMAGLIQYMVFHLYLHRGKEKRYQAENELLKMNEKFVQRQVELLADAKQYGEKTKNIGAERICENETINSILCAYAKRAKKENIHVKMNVKVEEGMAVREVDFAAVIANIFENAIRGCIESQSPEPEIYLFIARKGKKLAIQCKNTCVPDMKFRGGMPKSNADGGAGVSGIMKVVLFYHGETYFSVEENMFAARILLEISESGCGFLQKAGNCRN